MTLGFSIFLCIYSALGGLFALALVFYHLFLSTRNTTTNEYCKKNWDVTSGNPYRKSFCIKNCLKIFGNRTLAKLNPRERVEARQRKAAQMQTVNLSRTEATPAAIYPPNRFTSNQLPPIPHPSLNTSSFQQGPQPQFTSFPQNASQLSYHPPLPLKPMPPTVSYAPTYHTSTVVPLGVSLPGVSLALSSVMPPPRPAPTHYVRRVY